MALNYKYLRTTEEVAAILPVLNQKPILTVDTETTGLDCFIDKVILLQIGDRDEQFLIDTRSAAIEPLRELLENPLKPKVLHNANFDYKFIRSNFNICLENMIDTMIIEMVLENGLRHSGYGLKDMMQRYCQIEISKEEQTSFIGHKGEFSEKQLIYAANDVIYPLMILEKQIPRVVEEELEFTVKLECQVIAAFSDIEYNGVLIDVERWKGLIQKAEIERDAYKKKLDEVFRDFVTTEDLFGFVSINYDSDLQLKDVLRRLLKRDTKMSDKEIEEKLENVSKESISGINHPVKALILKYREHQKVMSTYGEGFLKHIHEKTGRIHPDFKQLGAESGRVSCTNPNLQNIKAGSDFRNSFIAGPGRKMVTSDYSGCELRIIAEGSRDPVFVKTFNEGGDLHAIVASTMFKVTVDKDNNKHLRKAAKGINFGLAYGMGAQGLSLITGDESKSEEENVHEAEQLLEQYFKTYPSIKAYLDASADEGVKMGYSRTMGGRKRYYFKDDKNGSNGNGSEDNQKKRPIFPKREEFRDEDEFQEKRREYRQQVGAIERKAKNTPIQGTNADMTKLALIWLREAFKREKLDIKIVNTVHDEIVVDCAEEIAEQVLKIVEYEMKRAGEVFIKAVPVDVEATIKDYWTK